jgi:hypothetical protein
MRAGAYELLIAIKLISALKRHSSCDSSRDSPFIRGGVSAAESSGTHQAAVILIVLVATSAT